MELPVARAVAVSRMELNRGRRTGRQAAMMPTASSMLWDGKC